MYHFQTLKEINMQQLAECFNLAFSDYEQPMHFTPDSLKYYLTASGVNLSLSFGAFYREQLVGFILNSSAIYQHQQVVFDAGTGVVPEHRDKKVFSGLFEYTVAQLRQQGITRYYLEVLQANHHALSIYRKKGFCAVRDYSVLAASGPGPGCTHPVGVIPYEDFIAFETKFSVEPSYEYTSYTINQNPQLYEVLCLPGQAYCIYAKRNGAIIQMHYQQLDALKEVISALISCYPAAWAKNIDCRYCDVLQMLTELGFTELTKQHEMARDL